MTINNIIDYISSHCPQANYLDSNEGIFFYSKEGQKFPFATIIQKDNEFDNLSNLNREGIFRLNIGISKATFISIFGDIDFSNNDWKKRDFTVLNTIIPHPMYAGLHRISILNPKDISYILPYLNESYTISLQNDSWIK